MVTPVTRESKWRLALESLPAWTPPKVPTLVISPHPDDETLGVGGLIYCLTKGKVDLSVVAVTDGENAYKGEVKLGLVRIAEQTAALRTLGVPPQKIHRLGMCDSGLKNCEAELTGALLAIARPGMHIVAPWIGDFHPDHEVCGRAAQAVAKDVGASLTFYFFWTWHRGSPATLDKLSLVSFPLPEDGVRKKNDALLCHLSQLKHPSGQPILPQNLLAPMQRPYEVFLPA